MTVYSAWRNIGENANEHIEAKAQGRLSVSRSLDFKYIQVQKQGNNSD